MKEVCIIYSATREDAWKYIQHLFIKTKIFKNLTILKYFSSEYDQIFQISNSTLNEISQDFDLTNSKLKTLLQRILDPYKGIDIKNRTFNLKNYPNCFIGLTKNDLIILGSELVSLICEELKIGRLTSVNIIQKYMFENHIVTHLTLDHSFEDDLQFYIFQLEMIDLIGENPIIEGYLTQNQLDKPIELYQILYSNGNFISFSKKVRKHSFCFLKKKF